MTWAVRLSDGSELNYAYQQGDLTLPTSQLGENGIVSYRLTLAVDTSSTHRITFRPPLREAASIGDRLEFDDPVVRVKLATDAEMDLALDYNRFSFPTVSFVEDV